jgi:multiple sugar transport system permease protein
VKTVEQDVLSSKNSIQPIRPKRGLRSTWIGWLFLAPAVVVLLFFFIVPLGYSVVMSTKDWPLLGSDRPTNFPENYTKISENELFINSILFTVKYTAIISIILLTLSLGLALLVQEGKQRSSGILRTVYFLPVVTGLSTAALLFVGFLNPTVGPMTNILNYFGMNPDWLGTPNLALTSTVLMMTWRFAGFYMVIMLSGLLAIPKDIYESAAVDGSSRMNTFRYITLPLMKSTLSLCLILILTGGMVAFEQFYILTSGGPDNSTVTIVMTIFRQAFSQFEMGSAAAMSVVLLLALILMNILQLRLVRKDESGESR